MSLCASFIFVAEYWSSYLGWGHCIQFLLRNMIGVAQNTSNLDFFTNKL